MLKLRLEEGRLKTIDIYFMYLLIVIRCKCKHILHQIIPKSELSF